MGYYYANNSMELINHRKEHASERCRRVLKTIDHCKEPASEGNRCSRCSIVAYICSYRTRQQPSTMARAMCRTGRHKNCCAGRVRSSSFNLARRPRPTRPQTCPHNPNPNTNPYPNPLGGFRSPGAGAATAACYLEAFFQQKKKRAAETASLDQNKTSILHKRFCADQFCHI